MSVIGISMVKDEADVIEATIRQMASQVDRLLIADNGSTDGTREILEQLATALPITVRDDPEVGYYQARKMTGLALEAGLLGASWVVPFDADEWWYSPFGRIVDVLDAHPEASVATAALFDHVATAADSDAGPVERIGWRRREPGPMPKVACVARSNVRIHQGNHAADYGETLVEQLVIRHFPYRSPEQFISKVRNGAAAYAATDLPEDEGKHWRDYGRLSDEALSEVFHEWFWSPLPEGDNTLIFDPCPTSA